MTLTVPWPRAGSAALLAVALLAAAPGVRGTAGDDDGGADALVVAVAREVDRRLEPPEEERDAYARRLAQSLAQAGMADPAPQVFVLVDRDPRVQALLVYLRTPARGWRYIGASPVSTGRPGAFEHFRTPLGVFAHTPDHLDFRALGTPNAKGIRGYGERGLRVFDFGWITTERGWRPYGPGQMRLQVHATDPVLERRLGEARSKGCIRIPASLNRFLDRRGLLDADYEAALARGARLWVLRADREPVRWPGRYLVVVDSGRKARPAWAPAPRTGVAGAADADAC